MLVETFEVPEVAEQTNEQNNEAMELAEKLGLEGQKDFFDTPTGVPVPYRRMSVEELFVYRELCPAHTKVESYKSGIIPLRALQVLEHARSLEYFEGFEVWHPTDASVRDPLLVGIKREGGEALYILARWGEVLDSLPTMATQAAAMWKARMGAKCEKAIAEAKAEREAIAQMTPEQCIHAKKVSWNWQGEPSYNAVLA